MTTDSQAKSNFTSTCHDDVRKQFDRIINDAKAESDLLDREIENLGESAKAFAHKHGVNEND